MRLTAFALLLTVATGYKHRAACFPYCRFTFCDGATEFAMPHANAPFTGPICEGKMQVMETIEYAKCEARVDGHTRISQWMPEGLMMPFPADFLHTVRLKKDGQPIAASGIARGEWYGTKQPAALNNTCIVIPLDSWAKQDSADLYMRHNNQYDCISFVTKT